jgi:hypothetical protein
MPDGLDHRDEGGRIGGVATEHLDGDGAPVFVGEQPVLDLGHAPPLVTRITPGRQLVLGPFHPRRRQVEIGQARRIGLFTEMTCGQFGLDGLLTFLEPVHGRIDLVG